MKSCTVAEANALWLRSLSRYSLPTEYVELENAKKRRLAENIFTHAPIPAFSKAAVDGYVINYGAKTSEPYHIIGTVGAGKPWAKALEQGEALRIMTGAPIPKGGNTVIMKERCREFVEKETDKITLIIDGDMRAHCNIILEGEECEAHTLLLKEGGLLATGALTLLSSLGKTKVLVYKQPRILLLTTGAEIKLPGQPLEVGEIYDSNGAMIQNLLEDYGFTITTRAHLSDLESVKEDEFHRLKTLIETYQIDLVISTGGVSVGNFDYMPEFYERLGAKTLYNRINMRPGAASYGGVSKDVIFFGLSGNPSAAFNAFYLLVLPVLKVLSGYKDNSSKETLQTRAFFDGILTKKNIYDRYLQGTLQIRSGEVWFKPSEYYNSGALLSLANCNALGRVPKGSHEVNFGDLIEVLPLDG